MIDRRAALGASDATIVVNGTPEQINSLWLYKTGQREAEDLSMVIPVQIGIATEAFNVRYFEQTTGLAVTRQQERISKPGEEWLVATLDGVATGAGGTAVFEAKHVNQFSKIDEVVARYSAQLHVQMWCAELERAYLSILIGTLKHEVVEVAYDWMYASEVIDACRTFWAHVQDKTPPGAAMVSAAPVVPKRVEDMTGNNTWASYAASYRETKDAAGRHEEAKKMLKALVEPDVVQAAGHGIIISRSKAGALSIKEV